MSDDESEVVYMRRTNANVLHYGSLEAQERMRLMNPKTVGSMAADAIQAGISAGNINVTQGRRQFQYSLVRSHFLPHPMCLRRVSWKCVLS